MPYKLRTCRLTGRSIHPRSKYGTLFRPTPNKILRDKEYRFQLIPLNMCSQRRSRIYWLCGRHKSQVDKKCSILLLHQRLYQDRRTCNSPIVSWSIHRLGSLCNIGCCRHRCQLGRNGNKSRRPLTISLLGTFCMFCLLINKSLPCNNSSLQCITGKEYD